MSNFHTIGRQMGFLLPPSVDEWLPHSRDEQELSQFGSVSQHPALLLGVVQ